MENNYCLDANVLIEAWNKYYSPKFFSDYWKILDEFGQNGNLFIPQMVFEEIIRTEDELSKWLKESNIPIHNISEIIISNLQEIYNKNPIHKRLVDSTKQRSLADPWIIAHALHEKAIVVTKEEKVTDVRSRRIKIPNVCENMGVRCINDFQLIEELNIKFSARVSSQ